MVKKLAWYPADDEKKHYKKSPKNKIAKLRKGIVPGSVLILLEGAHCSHGCARRQHTYALKRPERHQQGLHDGGA